ncbi:MAG: choice-of-anchor Q domain-containing protein [Anaerolineae bacterium]
MMRSRNSKVVARLSNSVRWLVILLLAMPGLTVWSAPAALATTPIVVTTTVDEFGSGSGCSLREAIQSANTGSDFGGCTGANAAANTITLPANTYTLTGAAGEDSNVSGDLDIEGTLTINGAGAATTIIQAGTDASNGVDRVLELRSNAVVEINGVTIRYGRTPDGVDGASDDTCTGGDGGGIYTNLARLILNDCIVMDNRTGDGGDGCLSPSILDGFGGWGGGIHAYGSELELNNTRVSSNQTGAGGDAAPDGDARLGGWGGGIYLGQGSAVIRSSIINRNRTGDGGRGSDAETGDAGNGGGGGDGAGIYNLVGALTLIDSSVSANITGAGGDGGDASAGDGGNGGSGGDGAGIYNYGNPSASTTDVTSSSITGNDAGSGGRGGSGTGSVGDAGYRGEGGGLYANNGAVVTLRDSTIGYNAGLYGGGLYYTSGVVATVDNCTISGNIVDRTGGGIYNGAEVALTNSTLSGNRAYVNGGGIYNSWEATLTHVTITDNTADLDNDGLGNGGGFINDVGTFTMVNTIVARNVDKGGENPDCRGDFTSQDYNLLGIGDSPACTFTQQAHDLVGTDAEPREPYLEVDLADNGGPTLTHALKPTSPAVDYIPDGVNGCVFGARDQRGVVRVPACDIGAYEIDQAEYLYLPIVLRNY